MMTIDGHLELPEAKLSKSIPSIKHLLFTPYLYGTVGKKNSHSLNKHIPMIYISETESQPLHELVAAKMEFS